jgi:hypothetical protein
MESLNQLGNDSIALVSVALACNVEDNHIGRPRGPGSVIA